MVSIYSRDVPSIFVELWNSLVPLTPSYWEVMGLG